MYNIICRVMASPKGAIPSDITKGSGLRCLTDNKKLLNRSISCLGGLMDKVVDSGSTDAGSIPVRDAS